MVKRRRELDSEGTTTASMEYNTVFVDTSLDTHLAMLVSNSDTVLDFKKKLVLEHMQCFPQIGEIRIHSLKVKRRANFYHLPDIMLVWSAFHLAKGNWFLSADASETSVCHLNQNPSELGTGDGVQIVRNVDDNCTGLSSHVNRILALPMTLPDGVTEKNVVSEMNTGLKAEKSLEKTIDSQINNYSEENCMETESHAKKTRKMRHVEDIYFSPSLKDNCALFHASGKDASIPKNVGNGNSMVKTVKEGPEGILLHERQGKPPISEATAEVSGVRNDQSDIEDKGTFEGTSAPATAEKSNLGSIVNSQNHKSKEDKKSESIIPENFITSKPEYELGQDVTTEHSGGVSVKVPDLSATLMGNSGAIGDDNSDGNKKKKNRKAHKTAAKFQDTTDKEQTIKDESVKPYTEAHKSEKKKEKSLSVNHDHEVVSLNHDREVIMPSYSNASEHADPDLTQKEASLLPQSMDANIVMEPEISIGSKKKKKKKEKKSANTNLENSIIEHTDNGISGSSDLLGPSTDDIPKETGKEERILYQTREDVQMKFLDSSTTDAGDKVKGANRNEVDVVILTQNKQTKGDVASGRKKMEKGTQSSAGNCHSDFPGVAKKNQAVEFNQVEKSGENTENKDGNAIKKRKKRKSTVSDVQENLPVKDQKVGIEILTTEEKSSTFINSEQEGRHVAPPQVLSHKSEEQLEEMHASAINTENLPRTSENEGEGINFKRYFMSGQYLDQDDSGDKVIKATRSNNEMKTGKKVKQHGLCSVSISTELQNSLKSFENQESEHKSHVKKAISRRQGSSAQNSDWDEVVPNSFQRSLRVSANEEKDSNPGEMLEMKTLQKPNEILTASSRLKEKNASLEKSSSERSETFPRKREYKRSQSGLNVTNKMIMKTPKQKSLLTKSRGIFQDNSGESSADENGTTHSDANTCSPSDSSSLSGYSVGESDLSQDSTRNGSNDTKGRSTGTKNMSKLDLSAGKDMTMDMILRSSKRFKKAKLLATQNDDSQQMEFVPDSEPI